MMCFASALVFALGIYWILSDMLKEQQRRYYIERRRIHARKR